MISSQLNLIDWSHAVSRTVVIASYKLLPPWISDLLYVSFLFFSLSLSPAMVRNTWSTGSRAGFSSKRETGMYRNQVKHRIMKEWEHLAEEYLRELRLFSLKIRWLQRELINAYNYLMNKSKEEGSWLISEVLRGIIGSELKLETPSEFRKIPFYREGDWTLAQFEQRRFGNICSLWAWRRGGSGVTLSTTLWKEVVATWGVVLFSRDLPDLTSLPAKLVLWYSKFPWTWSWTAFSRWLYLSREIALDHHKPQLFCASATVSAVWQEPGQAVAEQP